MRKATKLHLGCGNTFLPGYVNVDISSSFEGVDKPDAYFDIRHMPEIESDSIDEIYACHVLEHIKWVDIAIALREWHRVLRPGGVLKISTPDFDAEVQQYCRERPSNMAELPNLGGVFPGYPPDTPSHQLLGILVGGFDFSVGGTHATPFNEEALREILTKVGFEDIERYQSRTPDWSTKWPNSLNVVAAKVKSQLPRFTGYVIDSPNDVLDLMPEVICQYMVIGNELVFVREGRVTQEDMFALPSEALDVLQMFGNSTTRAILEEIGGRSDLELDLDFFLSLAANRVARFIDPSNLRTPYIISEELLQSFSGKATWPISNIELRGLRFANGVRILTAERSGPEGTEIERVTLLSNGRDLEIGAGDVPIFRLLRSVGNLEELNAEEHGERAVAGAQSMARYLLRQGFMVQ